MEYDYIDNDQKLQQLCDDLAGATTIAFDTEFVSEDTYRPELCLVQVAAGSRLAILDPYGIQDLKPFWQLLTVPDRETVAHAGREELRFCLEAVGQRPTRLFDVQIAAALVGLEYPAAYNTLVSKLLGKTLKKGETRTDWRRRPLSQRQLDYALQDVLHLEPLRDLLQAKLERLGRMSWLDTELDQWQQQIENAEASEQWRRVSGISGLSSRGLAIVRELWRWRDAEAQQRNRPPRRVLRDDLIVELARRQTADLKRIRAVRGLDYSHLRRHLPQLADRVQQALDLPDEECPKLPRRHTRPQLNLLGQFLTTALGSICRSAEVAPSIVGTAQDVRDLIAYHLKLNGASEPPALARGWRAEVVGQVIDHLLDGDLAIRITDPLSEHPLTFEPIGGQDGDA